MTLTAEDHLAAGYEKVKTPWDEDEDEKLLTLRDRRKLDWEEIAQQLPGRNLKMCYSRYKRLEYNPRANWKRAENDLLKELVEKNSQDWTVIASFFKSSFALIQTAQPNKSKTTTKTTSGTASTKSAGPSKKTSSWWSS